MQYVDDMFVGGEKPVGGREEPKADRELDREYPGTAPRQTPAQRPLSQVRDDVVLVTHILLQCTLS